ncbi:MAG TPA: Na+/H+ antiporter [Actinomycetota bacterium]|nr:Na+/H+ antiporter [Actinomycetota bacterium]
METLELLIGMLAAIAVVVTLAGRSRVPEPVLLVAAGLAVALVPGLPEVELDPELTLALFLPPLLYWAALHTNLRELRRDLRPISMLAVGLVVVTTGAVAVLAHAVLGLPWAVAAVLGAIVAPPDPVAAVAVAGRIGMPRRIVTVLEGEGLLNDATALVVYRMAVATAVSGAFSAGDAAVELVVSAVGGTLVGLAVAWAGSRVLQRVEEAAVENTIKLLLPYVAWLAAERLHASGVLAVLACGLLMSRNWGAISSAARLQARQLWDWLVFVLEGLSFVLVGLQLRTVIEGIEGRSAAELVWAALLLNLLVVAVRLAWVYPASWLPRALSARLRERDPFPGWAPTTVVGWAGMRGVVSLALALAVPAEVAGGGPFPERDLVVFLAFSVIVVTLVGQGLTLPLLVTRLGVVAPDEGPAADGARALARLSEVALARLDAIDPEAQQVAPALLDRLRERYRARLAHLDQQLDTGRGDGGNAYAEVVSELLQAQREELRRLREQGDVTAEVARRLYHDLDVEETRLERERPS